MSDDGFSIQLELQSLEKVTLRRRQLCLPNRQAFRVFLNSMGDSFFILKLNYKLNFKVPVGGTCSCVR